MLREDASGAGGRGGVVLPMRQDVERAGRRLRPSGQPGGDGQRTCGKRCAEQPSAGPWRLHLRFLSWTVIGGRAGEATRAAGFLLVCLALHPGGSSGWGGQAALANSGGGGEAGSKRRPNP